MVTLLSAVCEAGQRSWRHGHRVIHIVQWNACSVKVTWISREWRGNDLKHTYGKDQCEKCSRGITTEPELTMGQLVSRSWVMGQMGHQSCMGHIGYGSLAMTHWPIIKYTNLSVTNKIVRSTYWLMTLNANSNLQRHIIMQFGELSETRT